MPHHLTLFDIVCDSAKNVNFYRKYAPAAIFMWRLTATVIIRISSAAVTDKIAFRCTFVCFLKVQFGEEAVNLLMIFSKLFIA